MTIRKYVLDANNIEQRKEYPIPYPSKD